MNLEDLAQVGDLDAEGRESLQTQFSSLNDVPSEDLDAAHATLETVFAAADTDTNLDLMRFAASGIESIRAERDRRAAEAAEVDALRASVATDDTDAPAEAPAADDTETFSTEDDSTVITDGTAIVATDEGITVLDAEETFSTDTDDEDTPVAEVTEDNENTDEAAPADVTADVTIDADDNPDANADEAEVITLHKEHTVPAEELNVDEAIAASATPKTDAPAAVESTPTPSTITASAATSEVPGYSAGVPVDNAGDLMSRAFGVLKAGGNRINVLQRKAAVDGPRLGGPGVDNYSLISQAVKSREALVASGGNGAVPQAHTELFGVGSAEMPVANALITVPSARGRIVFNPALSLADVAGGVSIHDNDDDVAGTAKAQATIAAGVNQEAIVEAVVSSLKLGNSTMQFDPERAEDAIRLAEVQAARVAETKLLDDMHAEATAATFTDDLGAGRTFLAGLGRAVAALDYRSRLQVSERVQAFMPKTVIQTIREDFLRQHAGDSTYTLTDEQIADMIRAQGIDPVFSLDDVTGGGIGAQGVGALNATPTSVKVLLAVPGTFVRLDGGELNLGLVRDSGLNATNDVAIFSEFWQAIAKVGGESLSVTFTLDPSGEGRAAKAQV